MVNLKCWKISENIRNRPGKRRDGLKNLPLRGRGTAAQAAVEEGRWMRKRCAISNCSHEKRPSSVSLTRASSTFYGIAATGSYVRLDSLHDAPPGGEAFWDVSIDKKRMKFCTTSDAIPSSCFVKIVINYEFSRGLLTAVWKSGILLSVRKYR